MQHHLHSGPNMHVLEIIEVKTATPCQCCCRYAQAQAWVDDEHSLELLMRWTSAFSKILMWHVREECDLAAEMQVRSTTRDLHLHTSSHHTQAS